MKKRTAFSVAEVVVALVIISVFLAATLPSFTGKKNASKGTDYSTRTCIVKENASSVDTTTAPPFDTEFNSASADCKTVISNTAKNIGQSFDTLVYYSTEGTAAEQAAADKVIRAACDMGAVEACKYFIRRCSGDSTKCDISTTANNNDLHYYLTLVSNDLNPGRLVIMKEILPVYYSGEANLKAEVLKTCATGTGTACSLLAQSCGRSNNCSDVVTACNASDVAAADQNCQAGYNANINRTCTTIKQKTATTTDGAYHLTNDTNGDGKSFLAYCDMNTEGGGWTLMRRVAPSLGATYPVNDNLSSTAPYQVYVANPTVNSTFSLKFQNYPFTEMRFATGDNVKWLVVDKSAVYDDWDTNTDYLKSVYKSVRIKKSHLKNYPYNAFWLKRTSRAEDPWISASDHASFGANCSADNDNQSMLYGEGGAGCWSYYDINRNGLNVWVRGTSLSSTAPVIYKSCADIKSHHLSAGSGVHRIDPDGVGGNDPFEVYCDMTTDGGGWTMVARIAEDNQALWTNRYNSGMGTTLWFNGATYGTYTGTSSYKNAAFDALPLSDVLISFIKKSDSTETYAVWADNIGDGLRNFAKQNVWSSNTCTLYSAAAATKTGERGSCNPPGSCQGIMFGPRDSEGGSCVRKQDISGIPNDIYTSSPELAVISVSLALDQDPSNPCSQGLGNYSNNGIYNLLGIPGETVRYPIWTTTQDAYYANLYFR